MKRCRWMPAVFALAALFAAAPARSDDAGLDPARNELSVFGGLSIPNASGTATELGNSALIGLRYSFYLRKQLAIEADAVVAPSHDLHSRVGLCGSSDCYGRGDYMEAGVGHRFDMAMKPGDGRYDGGFGGRSVTAWHYGLGLAYDILGGDVRPYLTAGAGGVTYDGTPSARTDFVLRFGGGVKVYFGRLGARVDAVDYLVFDNSLTGRDEHDVHLTGGAFVRF